MDEFSDSELQEQKAAEVANELADACFLALNRLRPSGQTAATGIALGMSGVLLHCIKLYPDIDRLEILSILDYLRSRIIQPLVEEEDDHE